jgi:hypothetical protein
MNAKELLQAAQLIEQGGCKRCHKINVVAPVVVMQLAKGYKARLCEDCCNDWDRLLFNDSDWESVEDLHDRIEGVKFLMVHDGDEERLEMIKILRDEQRTILHQLFDRAETWVLLGVPPPTKVKE